MRTLRMLILISFMIVGCANSPTTAGFNIDRIEPTIVKIVECTPTEDQYTFGSGFVINKYEENSHYYFEIMTAGHVLTSSIEPAEYIVWTFSPTTKLYLGQILKKEMSLALDKDVGTLKIEVSKEIYEIVIPLTINKDYEVVEGERLYIYGCPLGKWANLRKYECVQVTKTRIVMGAKIAPGASGSPILNSQGEVIGILNMTGIDKCSGTRYFGD